MMLLFKRLQEPSTYAGLAAVLAGFGWLGLTEADWNQIFAAAGAVAGVAAMFLGEKDR